MFTPLRVVKSRVAAVYHGMKIDSYHVLYICHNIEFNPSAFITLRAIVTDNNNCISVYCDTVKLQYFHTVKISYHCNSHHIPLN